jgi:hypothetical protein
MVMIKMIRSKYYLQLKKLRARQRELIKEIYKNDHYAYNFNHIIKCRESEIREIQTEPLFTYDLVKRLGQDKIDKLVTKQINYKRQIIANMTTQIEKIQSENSSFKKEMKDNNVMINNTIDIIKSINYID